MTECRKCAASNPEDATFCTRCGVRISLERVVCVEAVPADKTDPTPTMLDIPSGQMRRNYAGELRTFIGPNQRYYLSRWRVMDNATGPGRIANWNWSSFLFSIGWFGFRKMYALAAGLALLLVALEVAQVSQHIPAALACGAVLALWAGSGLFGNYLYRRHVDRSIDWVRDRVVDSSTQRATMARLGGTSPVGAIVLPVGGLFLLILILMASWNGTAMADSRVTVQAQQSTF